MPYKKEEVKEELTLDDICSLLDSLDAEPEMFDNYIVAKTICHDGDSHKLYYYDNTQLFRCYTGDCGAFDIFELIQKKKDIDLNTAIYYVVNYFNLQGKIDEVDEKELSDDWKRLKQYNKLLGISINNDKVELPQINENILKYYPRPRYLNWEKEYITKEVCDYMNIHYDPVKGGILIPHYDENDRLVGIRERTLVQEDEKKGKYHPVFMRGKLRNHPLAFNLYGLNKSKENIKNIGVAMVFESEKAVLQSLSYLGTESNIAVAMCGSSLSNYQFHLLLDAGAKEIVIGLDKDFCQLGDEDFYETIKKIEKLNNKYKISCNISFMFDKFNLLGYKDSPTDKGKEAFLELWRNRIII